MLARTVGRHWLIASDVFDQNALSLRGVSPSVTAGRIPDVKLRSHRLPGGDFVNAVLNRQVMGLADRGGASGLVGRRWADLCAEWSATILGSPSQVPEEAIEKFLVDRVARLDDAPQIAIHASRRGLQNPDFVVIGDRDGRSIVQAADAKFSVETARSKQVSPEVVEALLTLGSIVLSLTGPLTSEIEFVPGLFLSPDYPLTHLMLQGRPGITRATVRPSEVVFVPVDPAAFFLPLPAEPVMHVLGKVDDLPVAIESSLLAGLYYFRLARAAVGAWTDSVKPLLFMNDKVEVDEADILEQATRRARDAANAFELVLQWDADVESVRARRAAVDQVTSVPILTRDLRTAISSVVKDDVEAGPSINQVRRRLGSWFRSELRAQFGPVPPDEPDFANQLAELGRASAVIAKDIPTRTVQIVRDLVAERALFTPSSDRDPIAPSAEEAVT